MPDAGQDTADRRPAEAPSSSSIEARLAVLEERTAPKPKTLVDRVKEWSGVATAVIAILYTFPLGFWDRWFEGPTARNVEALRSGIQQLADLEARVQQGAMGISDVHARQFYINAMNSQRAAILARLQPRIDQYRSALTVPELILLAYNLGLSGQVNLAASVYDTASDSALRTQAPVSFRADIYRMRAILAASQYNDASITSARVSYERNLQILSAHTDVSLQQQAANSALEWAFLEMTLPGGDLLCSDHLRRWAGEILTPMAHLNPQVSEFLAAHERRISNVPRRNDHQTRGCPPGMPPQRRGASVG